MFPSRYNRKISLNKMIRRCVQVFLICLTILAAYISIVDPGAPLAEAASPEHLTLRPPAESEGKTELLSGDLVENPRSAMNAIKLAPRNVGSTTYPIPELEPVNLSIFRDHSRIQLRNFPEFRTEFGGRFAGRTNQGDLVYYTLDPELQRYVSSIVSRANSPHVAAVAMDPRTGKILAIADKSKSIQNLSLHSGFPAASLFKVVTAAAAVERANLSVDTKISYRGGTYTLEPWNYSPDPRRDSKVLSLGEALGRSCNPVFGRVALQHLNPAVLESYSNLFGFNKDLQSDLPLPMSSALIPSDPYELSRTGAGFGAVHISPVHAVSLMSGLANGGTLLRPRLVERIVSSEGQSVYQAEAAPLAKIVDADTSQEVLRMMEYTTTNGTSRKEFIRQGKALLGDVIVAGKTGTLRGTDPIGLNTWFIGAAPMNNPKIAVAVIVVDPTASSKASRFGRQIIEKHLFGTVTETPVVYYKKSVSSKSRKFVKKAAPKKVVAAKAYGKSSKSTLKLKAPKKKAAAKSK